MESQLIRKIKKLKQIKPSRNWVILTKNQILGEEPQTLQEKFSMIFEVFPRFFFQPKLVFATLITLGVLISSTFIWAQNSLPGDFLYSFKRISEKGQAVFVSEDDKSKNNLGLANKRLEELTEIAETNQVTKLASAIEEVQASMIVAAESLKNPQKLEKEIVVQAKRLEENKQKIESLGIIMEDGEELDNTLSQLIMREIEDIENRTLTENQEELFQGIKQEFEAGNYAEALEGILFLSYPQE